MINRIVLIGNGFDLAHGLPTRYEDFIDWYWKQWWDKLRSCHTDTMSDELCTFTLKNQSTWHCVLWNSVYSMNVPSGEEFIKWIYNNSKYFKVTESDLFLNITKALNKKKWVDIENEYYNALYSDYIDCPEKLNKEFDFLRLKLVEYLVFVQRTNEGKSLFIEELQNIILEPINESDVAIGSQSQFIKFVKSNYGEYYGPSSSMFSISERLSLERKDYHKKAMRDFSQMYGQQLEYEGIESLSGENRFPELLRYPYRLMILNFNYTNTADHYLPEELNNEFLCGINHIHGILNEPDSVIFGFGDEDDKKYKDIVKLNNNELLKNMKSIKYLEANNYRSMLPFIDSAPYQIYIMGHSCGNSDRTLLNTLFEHKNCVSIKPFYFQKDDGSDNYMDIVQNISRNFTDMKLMRDRVVNKTLCKPLPQYVK